MNSGFALNIYTKSILNGYFSLLYEDNICFINFQLTNINMRVYFLVCFEDFKQEKMCCPIPIHLRGIFDFNEEKICCWILIHLRGIFDSADIFRKLMLITGQLNSGFALTIYTKSCLMAIFNYFMRIIFASVIFS